MSPPLFPKLGPDKLRKRAILKNNLVQRLKQEAAAYMTRFPEIEPDLFPKKTPITVFSLEDHVSLYAIDNVPILVQTGDHHVFPHLQVAIEYRGLLRHLYVDDGAVRALLRGADLMAPGIKEYDDSWEEGDILEIRVQGSALPFAIGIATIDSAAVPGGKGKAVEIVHILKDGLWDLRAGLL
jgi:PUA domain protein